MLIRWTVSVRPFARLRKLDSYYYGGFYLLRSPERSSGSVDHVCVCPFHKIAQILCYIPPTVTMGSNAGEAAIWFGGPSCML